MRHCPQLKRYSNGFLVIQTSSEHLKLTGSGNLIPITENVQVSIYLKIKSAANNELPGGDANTFLVEGYLTSPLPGNIKKLSGKYQCELNGNKGILDLTPTIDSPFTQIPTKIQGIFARQN